VRDEKGSWSWKFNLKKLWENTELRVSDISKWTTSYGKRKI
jgi:hypothetical protein